MRILTIPIGSRHCRPGLFATRVCLRFAPLFVPPTCRISISCRKTTAPIYFPRRSKHTTKRSRPTSLSVIPRPRATNWHHDGRRIGLKSLSPTCYSLINMTASSPSQDRSRPEILLRHLVAQLSRHALCDALLIFVPPILALTYIAAYLNRAAWIEQRTMILVIGVAVAVGVVAAILRYRPLIPSVRSAAQLVDQRAGAMDRFLTLATIETGPISAPFVERLREESAEFGERITLRRDFPYKIKRSAYWSVAASVIVTILIHLVTPLAVPAIQSRPMHQRLKELVDQMARKPALSRLANDLKSLETKLENPQLPRQEKQELIEEMESKIAEQQKKEVDKE